MRTFIAVEISEATRSALAAAQKAMGRIRQVRWANPATIHLTLKFIGEIGDSAVPAVFEAMRRAAEGLDPVGFQVRGLGWFPSGRRPRVLWAGVEEPTGALEKMARRLDERLAQIGVAPEPKPYRPHITLGRARGQADAAVVEENFSRAGQADFGSETAEEIVLFMSELLPSGAAHTRVGTVKLG